MYNSFVLHDYLTGFACADDLRTEFSYQTPDKNRQEEGREKGINEGGEMGIKEVGEEAIEEVGVVGGEAVGGVKGGASKEKKLPCYDAAMRLWGPNYLLELAILLYVGTIWLYWAMAWRMDLEGSGVRSRNVCFHELKPGVVIQTDNR